MRVLSLPEKNPNFMEQFLWHIILMFFNNKKLCQKKKTALLKMKFKKN